MTLRDDREVLKEPIVDGSAAGEYESSFSPDTRGDTYLGGSAIIRRGRYLVNAYSGYLLLVIAQLFNSMMVVTCKLLETDKNATEKFNPLQILFARLSITLILCLLYMKLTKRVTNGPWGPKRLRGLLFIRGAVGFFGVFGLYFSLQYLSMSDAVAITFLVPMVTAFLASVILHEKYSLVEGLCSLISLLGVLLIAKPDFIFGVKSDKSSEDDAIESASTQKRLLATGVSLIGVVGSSFVYIILRKLGKEVHPLIAVTYLSSTCTLLSFLSIVFVPSLKFILPESSYQWFLLFLIGLSGFLMQFLLTAGVQRVAAGRASLVNYISMVFSIVWDFILFGHVPHALSIIGILLISTSAAYMARNAQVQKDQDTESQVESTESNNNKCIPLKEFHISDDDTDSDHSKNWATRQND